MKRRAVPITMALLMCGSLVGCNQTTQSKDETKKTVIECMNVDGGVGRAWLDNAARRFEEKQKDVSYESGKVGVKINVSEEIPIIEDVLGTSGYNIYFNEYGQSPAALAQKGFLMDITDIVTEKAETLNGQQVSIEDKIPESYRSTLKGSGDKYYALPHYEWYPGIVYDIETFDLYKLYFADPSTENAMSFTSAYGTAKFVNSLDNAVSKKTCGNDGVYGTEDDGLPTTFREFLILCDKMTKHGVTPFTVAGFHTDYTAYLESGLLAAMLGYDGIMNYFDFEGTAEVLTGYSEEKLFDGVSYVKAPTTQTVTFTEETGYLTRDIVERYYIAAFMEVIYKQDWYSQDAKNVNVTHTDTQYNFVLGGVGARKRIGMLMEGSYWYNEAKDATTFDDYALLTNGKQKKIGWMSLPTSLDTPVTEGNGRDVALMDTGSAFAYINARTASNEGLTEACKDFLQFLYTDAELKAFTATSGSAKAAMEYDFTDDSVMSQLSDFQKSVMNLKKNGKVIYQSHTNATFKAKREDFLFSIMAPAWCPIISNVSYNCYLDAFRAGRSAKDCFEATRISQADWTNLYYSGE